MVTPGGLPGPEASTKRIGPVSFTVNAGQCVAVRGPSGSGKTTLLRALAALDAPTGGTLSLDERAPEAWGVPNYRRQVTYLAQQVSLMDVTVQEALSRPFSFTSAQGATFPEQLVQEWLQALGLEAAVMQRRARDLSVGERQRISLVRSLSLQPRFILLDEPTSALDPAATEAVEGLLSQRLKEGLGLVLVSHDAAQRERLAGETVVLP